MLGSIKNIWSQYIVTSNVIISQYIDMCLLESINLKLLIGFMTIKPCDHYLKPSCDHYQYCMSLLVVIILQTEVYKHYVTINVKKLL